jgi:hypothetical protein
MQRTAEECGRSAAQKPIGNPRPAGHPMQGKMARKNTAMPTVHRPKFDQANG